MTSHRRSHRVLVQPCNWEWKIETENGNGNGRGKWKLTRMGSRIEHWAGCERTIRAFVPVKVVNCENEFPDMVKGSLAHKVQLCQSYKQSSLLDQLFPWAALFSICIIIVEWLLHYMYRYVF